jgi:LacI family transcriptional regulator
MAKPRRVTIKEIAEEAGVSLQTVSRVINNRPDVAAETRRRVQAIIAARNYVPSSAARGITQGRSYILGVISAGLEFYGPAGMLMGIENHASSLGYTIILRVVRDPEQFAIQDQLHFFQSQHTDGIIWTLPEIGALRDSIVRIMPRFQIPSVYVNMSPHPALTVIDFDNRLGARLAVEHLLDQGCRTISLIQGPMTWLSARQRHQGWIDGLTAAGIEPADNLVAQGNWSARSGARAMAQILTQRPDADAVFVSNDRMALGALKAARQFGRQVPHNLAMVGYDNIPETEFYFPPLTTVINDLETITCFIVERLDRMIAAAQRDEPSQEPASQLLPPQLIIRESSGGGKAKM